jgi:predicted ATP-dependent endonuclease of OLD family
MQDTFFEQQFFEHFKDHTSEGLRTLRRLGDTLEKLYKVSELTKESTQKVASKWNTSWQKRTQEAWDLIAPTGDKGPATLLLDEPDRSISPILFHRVLRLLSHLPGKGVQVILVSHSPQAAQLQGPVNFIETEVGFVEGLRVPPPPLTVSDTVDVADYRAELQSFLQTSLKRTA